MADNVTIDPVSAVAFGIAGWAARGLRTNEWGRPSAIGFVLGAVGDLVYQAVAAEFIAKSSIKDKKLMAIIIASAVDYIAGTILVPGSAPDQRVTVAGSAIDSIVGNVIGGVLTDALE